ncbi:hypothetical protein GCM10028789_22610 [Sinomonas halotolerans]
MLAALLVASCAAPGKPVPTAAAGATGAGAGATQSPAPLETSQTSAKSPVYWLGRSRDGVFLYREFREAESDDNPVVKALRIMMDDKPLDPDYFSPWQKPKKLAASVSGTNIITVDVSKDAFSTNVDERTAQLAVQQLVYTATAAAATAGLVDTSQTISVMLLVDGRTSQLAFERVQLGQAMQRDVSMAARAWIIDPQEGAALAGQLKVTGRVAGPEASIAWQVLRKDDTGAASVYLSGTAQPSRETGRAGEFRFAVNLEDGDYAVRILPSADASAPADSGGTEWDSKSFRIGD